MPDYILDPIRRISFWLLWPAIAFVVWSELTREPPAFLVRMGDLGQHFAAYAVIALLAALGLRVGIKLLVAIPCILGLGALLEYLQNWTVRSPDMMNMIAKIFGVVVGLCAGAIFLHLVEPTPEDYPPTEE